MDAIAKFQYLSLVSKVTTELDNHLGVNNKDLAEFIVNLVDQSPTLAVPNHTNPIRTPLPRPHIT